MLLIIIIITVLLVLLTRDRRTGYYLTYFVRFAAARDGGGPFFSLIKGSINRFWRAVNDVYIAASRLQANGSCH